MKEFELCSIDGYPGNYSATIYSRFGNYYTTKRFLFMTKRDMFNKLRREYDCEVARRFYDTRCRY